MSKTQNSCPHVTYNPVERGQIVLHRDINYGENLDSKRMKSYWDEERAISYKASHKRLSIK